MVGDLELVGLMVCQLLFVVAFIWTVIDGGFFEAKPKIVDLGRIDKDGNRKVKCVYTETGTRGFQGLVQGQGNKSVTGVDGPIAYVQRASTEGDLERGCEVGQESGCRISSRALCEGEAKRARYDKRSQEGPELDHSELREYLERRAEQCGLFGSRVKHD